MGRDTRDEDARDATCRRSAESRHLPEPDRTLERWSVARDLTLPRSRERTAVLLDRERFTLRASESELLATVGAFRAVALRDLEALAVHATNIESSPLDADVRSLREQGLLHTHQLTINGRPEHVAVLTAKGRELLERACMSPDKESHQRFYDGLVKTRELSHDAQLYRMFETERAQLERAGASVTRVVLDYELKAEYHAEVHARQQAGVDAADARQAFAREHELPFPGGHTLFPDVRIEYETSDGRIEHRDLELATEHYSRSQLSGKQTAGFRVYRAAGAGSRRGGVPSDPHHLEWLG